tara:strand:- start:90 stop:425 length:336 start_codon:yes stop_codon:yes gene_type:complete
MALTQTRLSGPAVVINTGTYGGVHTTASSSTIVKQIVLSNITASAQTVTVTLKPNGVTIADTHILFKDLSLTEKETTLLNLSVVMNTGDEIHILCGTATSVNATVNGIVVT